MGRAKYCSKRCYNEAKKKTVTNIKNPNWKGGKSFEPYGPEWTSELRESIRKRDNYICQLCSLIEEEHIIIYGEVLSIHHINYDKLNCSPNNLTALCKQCSARVNFNREYWRSFFNERVRSNRKI